MQPPWSIALFLSINCILGCIDVSTYVHWYCSCVFVSRSIGRMAAQNDQIVLIKSLWSSFDFGKQLAVFLTGVRIRGCALVVCMVPLAPLLSLVDHLAAFIVVSVVELIVARLLILPIEVLFRLLRKVVHHSVAFGFLVVVVVSLFVELLFLLSSKLILLILGQLLVWCFTGLDVSLFLLLLLLFIYK